MGLHVDRELSIKQLPWECVANCSHGGSCDEDVAYWRERLGFTVDRERAIRCLEGYGAWTCEELEAMPDEEIADIVLWEACNTFKEWDGTEDSPGGSEVFVLE